MWELGKVQIPDEHKLAIAEAFGMWVGEIFPWSDIVKTPPRLHPNRIAKEQAWD